MVLRKQFWRFLLAGSLAAAANFGSRFLFSLWVSYEWAIVFAFLVGMAVAFLLMREYVFNARGNAFKPQAAKFLIVNIFALAQTLAVSVVLAQWVLPAVGAVSNAQTLGHFAGVAVPIVTSYFGHRLLTFR